MNGSQSPLSPIGPLAIHEPATSQITILFSALALYTAVVLFITLLKKYATVSGSIARRMGDIKYREQESGEQLYGSMRPADAMALKEAIRSLFSSFSTIQANHGLIIFVRHLPQEEQTSLQEAFAEADRIKKRWNRLAKIERERVRASKTLDLTAALLRVTQPSAPPCTPIATRGHTHTGDCALAGPPPANGQVGDGAVRMARQGSPVLEEVVVDDGSRSWNKRGLASAFL